MKKVTKKEKKEKVIEPKPIPVLEKIQENPTEPLIAEIVLNFGREDLNQIAAKLNEVIRALNK